MAHCYKGLCSEHPTCWAEGILLSSFTRVRFCFQEQPTKWRISSTGRETHWRLFWTSYLVRTHLILILFDAPVDQNFSRSLIVISFCCWTHKIWLFLFWSWQEHTLLVMLQVYIAVTSTFIPVSASSFQLSLIPECHFCTTFILYRLDILIVLWFRRVEHRTGLFRWHACGKRKSATQRGEGPCFVRWVSYCRMRHHVFARNLEEEEPADALLGELNTHHSYSGADCSRVLVKATCIRLVLFCHFSYAMVTDAVGKFVKNVVVPCQFLPLSGENSPTNKSFLGKGLDTVPQGCQSIISVNDGAFSFLACVESQKISSWSWGVETWRGWSESRLVEIWLSFWRRLMAVVLSQSQDLCSDHLCISQFAV